MQTRYVVQAGLGQAELWSLARPIEDVLADPQADDRTKVLLREAELIIDFADQRGLDRKGNYENYVELDRGAVVWFLAAAKPLALEAETWWFPVVGSFPYLGWFDGGEALQIRKRLHGQGLDVYMRPVQAYSTGGWLDDPVLSTMLSPEEDAFRYLSNTLLHELTHANVFVYNQTVFNESIASFVGDTMAEEYLIQRFGAESTEVALYREELELSRVRGQRFVETYKTLESLYGSDKSTSTKLAEKNRITRQLMIELDLSWEPNNASLMGFKTYNTGLDDFAHLYTACGRRWDAFFEVMRGLEPDDLGPEQSEVFGPVVRSLEGKCKKLASRPRAPGVSPEPAQPTLTLPLGNAAIDEREQILGAKGLCKLTADTIARR